MDNDFLAWVAFSQTKNKAYVDMSNMKTAAQLEAEKNPQAAAPGGKKLAAGAQAEPAVELQWKTFKDLGTALQKPTGIVVTKDIYGKGPEEHGAAFKTAGDRQADAEAWLTENGFKKKGAYSWYQGNFRVDIGKDAKNTYMYITDDEGTAAKEMDAITVKNVPGRHDQKMHGHRGTGVIGGGLSAPTKRGNVVRTTQSEGFDRDKKGSVSRIRAVVDNDSKNDNPDRNKKLRALDVGLAVLINDRDKKYPVPTAINKNSDPVWAKQHYIKNIKKSLDALDKLTMGDLKGKRSLRDDILTVEYRFTGEDRSE